MSIWFNIQRFGSCRVNEFSENGNDVCVTCSGSTSP